MSLILRYMPPALFALAGVLFYASAFGNGFFALGVTLFSLVGVAVLSLLAAPLFSFERASTLTPWIMALWLIPILGYTLSDTVDYVRCSAAMSFPPSVQHSLSAFHAQSGHYPADLAVISTLDPRRHLLRYSTDATGYQFILHSHRHGEDHLLYTSANPSWIAIQPTYEDD